MLQNNLFDSQLLVPRTRGWTESVVLCPSLPLRRGRPHLGGRERRPVSSGTAAASSGRYLLGRALVSRALTQRRAILGFLKARRLSSSAPTTLCAYSVILGRVNQVQKGQRNNKKKNQKKRGLYANQQKQKNEKETSSSSEAVLTWFERGKCGH